MPEAGSRLSIGAACIGAGVQHYLIEAAETPQNGVRLESSDFVFDNLPALLAHYCQCCDELPVRLKLPARIRNCSNRPSLTSLASLGNFFKMSLTFKHYFFCVLTDKLQQKKCNHLHYSRVCVCVCAFLFVCDIKLPCSKSCAQTCLIN